ncbi:outer membrane beta-barrel protein [Parabacteroides sp. FAFU027]|uniref:outer membrane beta-barrel protein n=1 Tax=Parabacteroides sp. FAFU027 TaxID=2922715 RepID=UPI001FB0208C|nr:outer membrane beta-barrel protein [Parabacteroides sp. FAFU027]
MRVLIHKRFPLLLLSVLFILTLKAQSDFRTGYIITLQGDTVYGLINLRGEGANAKSCVFKSKSDQKKTIYTPQQLRSFCFTDGKYYVSGMYLTPEVHIPQFLEYIYQGSLNILYYPDDSKDHYFAMKDTSVIELDHRARLTGDAEEDSRLLAKAEKFKGQLKYLTYDQPALAQKIEKMTCNSKDLISIAAVYQSLSLPSRKGPGVKLKRGKRHSVGYGFFLSSGSSNLTSPPYNMYINDYNEIKSLDFKTAMTYEVGANVDFYPDYSGRNRFCIQLSPALNFVEYKSNVERPLEPLLYIYNLDIKFTALKIPVLLKYSFNSSSRKFIPFMKGGPGCMIYLSSKGYYEYYSTPLWNQIKPETTYIKPLNDISGDVKFYITVGTGVDMKCGKRLLTVGANYLHGEGQLKGLRSDLQLQVGYTF